MVKKELERYHFHTVLRWVKTVDSGRVKQISQAAAATLKSLGVKPDPTKKARRGVPKGSDQFDLGSFLRWLERVNVEDTKAVNQIVAIHATAVNRLTE